MNHPHLIPEDKIPFALSLDLVALYSTKNKNLKNPSFYLIEQGVKRGKLEPIACCKTIYNSGVLALIL